MLDPAVQVLAASFVSLGGHLQESAYCTLGFCHTLLVQRNALCCVCLARRRKHFNFKPLERVCSANQTSFYLAALLSLMAYWFTLLSQVGSGPAFCPIMCLSVLQFHILSRTQTCSSMLGSSSNCRFFLCISFGLMMSKHGAGIAGGKSSGFHPRCWTPAAHGIFAPTAASCFPMWHHANEQDWAQRWVWKFTV